VTPTAVALIPARGGSLRVPGKNVRELAGHPLLAYSIAAARDSGRFGAIVVSTDDEATADVARRYGALVPGLRPAAMATSTSPDIEWIVHVLGELDDEFELFSILRPTSPFRTGATIRRAWDALLARGDAADSVRAVEAVRQHPAKMWTIDDGWLRPLLASPPGEVPLHSRQFHSLPEVWVQDSSLEIAWVRVLADRRDIAGDRIVAFESEGWEGFSIDYPDDWALAERLAASGEAELPKP
jgi:CMP-N,N'-diacetyllegionaminic acid synthase